MRSWKKHSLAFLLVLTACTAGQDGAVEGRISPPTAGARVAATQNGRTVATIDAGMADGKFRIALAAGSYNISATVPQSPFPVTFPGITVTSGETTTLPPIELSAPAGSASVAGKIAPPAVAANVTLLYEGKERASRQAGPDGSYEFTGLPAGRYTMVVHAPGYASDTVELNIAEDRRESRALRLIPVSAVEGIDWSTGRIRASGIGLPPLSAPNTTIRRELAKRAALADGQRNLLRIIEQVRVDSVRTVKTYFGEGRHVEKLQGFVRGFKLVAERERDDGGLEVELELPLTGPGGLSSYIQF